MQSFGAKFRFGFGLKKPTLSRLAFRFGVGLKKPTLSRLAFRFGVGLKKPTLSSLAFRFGFGLKKPTLSRLACQDLLLGLGLAWRNQSFQDFLLGLGLAWRNQPFQDLLVLGLVWRNQPFQDLLLGLGLAWRNQPFQDLLVLGLVWRNQPFQDLLVLIYCTKHGCSLSVVTHHSFAASVERQPKNIMERLFNAVGGSTYIWEVKSDIGPAQLKSRPWRFFLSERFHRMWHRKWALFKTHPRHPHNPGPFGKVTPAACRYSPAVDIYALGLVDADMFLLPIFSSESHNPMGFLEIFNWYHVIYQGINYCRFKLVIYPYLLYSNMGTWQEFLKLQNYPHWGWCQQKHLLPP